MTTNDPHPTPLAEQAQGHFAAGLALAQAGRMAEAAAAFDRAIALAPDLAEAHFNRALALDRTGDLAGAVESAGRAAKLRPDWPDAHGTLRGARCDGVDEAVVQGHLLPPCHAQIPLLSRRPSSSSLSRRRLED